ncbi:hypothetical protein ABZU32_20370 [Sphaerisporangium sp. NPDC005288]|uniref:hypothetical protein n=1 Tax=Sphaerisporangium sp. NPDC005288 TaxID=3155114 RepID=UPI0033B3FD49
MIDLDSLGPRGARLWASLVARDESLKGEDAPAREVALTACRTADRVERLEELAEVTEPVVEGRTGPVIHPVFAEVRQQAALLARLVAALRLPDEESGKRPQRRQLRGVQQPTGSTPGTVSSLERARKAAGRG